MIPKPIYLSILSLLLISSGVNTLWANSAHEQIIDGTMMHAGLISPLHFSNLPIGRPFKNQVDKDLSDLVHLAREIVGRIDMTSVSGWALEQTHDQKNSKSSLHVTDDCFLLPGQNTKHVASQNVGEDGTCLTSAIRHDKSITKDSPTFHPLSFTREYLQTKK